MARQTVWKDNVGGVEGGDFRSAVEVCRESRVRRERHSCNGFEESSVSIILH